MRFGRTKVEIQVEKGDFQGDFFRGLDLDVNQLPHPTTFGRNIPQKNPSLKAFNGFAVLKGFEKYNDDFSSNPDLVPRMFNSPHPFHLHHCVCFQI